MVADPSVLSASISAASTQLNTSVVAPSDMTVAAPSINSSGSSSPEGQ